MFSGKKDNYDSWLSNCVGFYVKNCGSSLIVNGDPNLLKDPVVLYSDAVLNKSQKTEIARNTLAMSYLPMV